MINLFQYEFLCFKKIEGRRVMNLIVSYLIAKYLAYNKLEKLKYGVILLSIKLIYGHKGGPPLFFKLILFYRFLSELSNIFNRLKKFKVIF